MHPSVMAWVADVVSRHQLSGRVALEVGSRNVNGSVRDLFTGPYCGIDRVDGPGVDVVRDVEGTFPALWHDHFGVIVSTEMLEHTLRPERALHNMAQLARPDGALILTCRGYDHRGAWEVHDAPDYWRFSGDALSELLAPLWAAVTVEADPDGPGWFCLGLGRHPGTYWSDPVR